MTEVQALPPFAGWVGPRQPKMLLVGEAWGENEAALRQPFVGYSGKELWLMLGEAMPQVAPELHAEATTMHRYDLAWVKSRGAWLDAAGIAMTNVFALRPPDNKVEALCVGKKDPGVAPGFPSLVRGQYLRADLLPELTRLFVEIEAAKPNIVIALGNTACWALLRAVNIGSIRGAVAESADLVLGPGAGQSAGPRVKVLPTYHPAAVLRQWSWRPIVVSDLMKGWREAQWPEIRRPKRAIKINLTLPEILAWTEITLQHRPAFLSADIETGAGQIKCISFAKSKGEAMVVSFVDQGKPGYSYWDDPRDEAQAWDCVRALLESNIPKVGQNFIYDLQYLTRVGIRPRNCIQDTMLLHHSMFPELQKGLGFLGSIYSDEFSWKLMRRQRPDTEKRDE